MRKFALMMTSRIIVSGTVRHCVVSVSDCRDIGITRRNCPKLPATLREHLPALDSPSGKLVEQFRVQLQVAGGPTADN